MYKKIYNSTLFISLTLFILAYPISAYAEYKYSIGTKLMISKWTGTNGTGSEYKSSYGNQYSVNFSIQKDKFYSGLNLQDGKYQFSNGHPERGNGESEPLDTNGNPISQNRGDQQQRNEIDLVLGYYFWDKLSLFLDYKVIKNKSNDNLYTLNFSGIGIGVSGFYPINHEWTFTGSFGIVRDGSDPYNPDGVVVNSESTAAEIAMVYKVNELNLINFGYRSNSQEYQYYDGVNQTHEITGIFAGYSYLFH